MIVVNITLSFANELQNSAITWLKSEYIPLLKSCPIIADSLLYSIDAQGDADECFALQIHFANTENFTAFEQKYQQDFDAVLFAKFTNQFGMFKTVLRSL